MKKNLAVLAGISLAALSLASCNTKAVEGGRINVESKTYNYTAAPAAPTYSSALANKGVDIYINYNGESGITFRGTSWHNTIDGKTYTQGALLPTWQKIQEVTGTTIREASGYKATSNDNAYTAIATAGYKSETDSNQNIDLFYNSVSNLKTAGNAGSLVDLNDYLDQMPNLKAYLEANPAIKNQISVNGHLYYAPSIDGSNDVENAFIMDTKMVKAVLVKNAGDENGNGATATANTLQAAKYTGFIDVSKQTSVDISVDGVKVTKTLSPVTKGIIAQQNDLLATGCSGKQLANQLIDYINERYAGIYTNPWDLYISESAAYTVDDLIALMRVIKANPKLLTGHDDAEIEVFIPRGESASAIESVYDLAQLWGVQGVDSANGNYYFAADGTLNSLETTTGSYEALDYISALYDEGLILGNFYVSSAQSTSTRYLEQYFNKTMDTTGYSYAFMMYDDIAIASSANDEIGGLGTSKSARTTGYSDYTNTEITAVLAPITYWATEGNAAKDSLKQTTKKTLTRYYESSRTLQSTSWAIPKTSDSLEAALRIMDFMYSDYGKLIQNYGPEAYWANPGNVTADLVSNEVNAVISDKTKLEIADSTLDLRSFMRGYLGAGHGIGVCLDGFNKQAINAYGQVGLTNIQKAISSGVLQHATTSTTYSWNVSVPSIFSTSVTDDKNAWDGITGFWNANKINKNEGWVNVVVSDYQTSHDQIVIKTAKNGLAIKWDKMEAQMDARDKNCLYTIAKSLGENVVPSYAKN